MQGLTHPHIVRVLDGPAEHKEFHYFVMDYVSGGDLFRAVLSHRLDQKAALLTVLQVGSALEYAHSRGLIHRDVKPQNILVDEQGMAGLTDFDLVWASDTTGGTRTGAMGTFLYSAPEEMEDASRVDRRADVYALGMTTLFVLHGKKLTRRVLDARALFIDGLECPEATRALLRRTTAPDPEDRPATVELVCRELAETMHIGHQLKERSTVAPISFLPSAQLAPSAVAPQRVIKRRSIVVGIIMLLAAIGLGLGIRHSAAPGQGTVIVNVIPPRAAIVYVDGQMAGPIEANSSYVIWSRSTVG